ncbi:hypothetical protein CI109_101002 [Kwoniella shandongensis]|uniref:Uncharacterized protein n=1 Tax=Kwoniella shandongensis TaxID=1734106 RepID=A0A5M6C4M9_9TREE|nr:uncharacterized protein CI109_001472 [Kwoniella shandongensis]KAA5530068.1 hypothetical protein CI109_001472 [Kwoniella shandongensis]
MSVAIVQGCSSGLGLALTQHILRHTNLTVYALTHQSTSSEFRDRIAVNVGKGKERLTVLSGVDVREERGLEKAAETVKEREGKGSVRLVACLAGVLHAEKSLGAIDLETALSTFQINTLGHLLTYKHFVPLIPNKREFKSLQSSWQDPEKPKDPARGMIGRDNSLCFSLSARVGSISDNERGGWYSYRASKAALNQVVRCLDHELANKSSSAIAVGYHPGTVLTSFTSPIIGKDAKPDLEHGRLTVDQAIDSMTKVMGKVTREGDEKWGGRCWDWKGERIEW